MSSSNTIFNEPTVRITQKEYQQLLEYKAICQDIYRTFKGDNNEL